MPPQRLVVNGATITPGCRAPRTGRSGRRGRTPRAMCVRRGPAAQAPARKLGGRSLVTTGAKGVRKRNVQPPGRGWKGKERSCAGVLPEDVRPCPKNEGRPGESLLDYGLKSIAEVKGNAGGRALHNSRRTSEVSYEQHERSDQRTKAAG